MRYWLSLGLVLATLSLASAQQEPKSCETQLQEVSVQLELLERTMKLERQQFSGDLVRWSQRAQQAEQRLAKAQQPPAPPAEGAK